MSGQAVSRMKVAAQHTAAKSFTAGRPLGISMAAGTDVANVEMMYRHVNQGERWKSEPMEKQGSMFTASIPGEYTQSVYPLQYYFVLRGGREAAFHPEFNASLSNEPYFSVWKRG